MSRVKSFVSAGLIAGALMAGSLGVASADHLSNPGNPQADNSNNCIAVFSSQVIKNGSFPTLGQNASGGARGAEIKLLQATCGAQAE